MRFYGFSIGLLVLLCCEKTIYSQNNFRTIPATSYEVVDGVTAIEMTVSVSEFSIAKTEVTQKEFWQIMNYNPSYHQGADYPVENVSWWEAIQYCNRRSLAEGLQPCYNLPNGECDFSRNGYRLPTDAEWKQASGDPTRYDAQTLHHYANLGSTNTQSLEQLSKALKETGTRKVGSYPANPSGLYDMLGNVWEMVSGLFQSRQQRPGYSESISAS